MVRLAIAPPSKVPPPPPVSKATARANSAEVSVAFCTDDYIQNVRLPSLDSNRPPLPARPPGPRVLLPHPHACPSGSPTLHQLNRDYRGMDKPTDVLSFPLMEQDDRGKFFMPGGRAVLGDVIISVDTARRQAAERGHSLQREVQILLVHGVLHLLGHDHENGGEEAVAMAVAEARAPAALPLHLQCSLAAPDPLGRASHLARRTESGAERRAIASPGPDFLRSMDGRSASSGRWGGLRRASSWLRGGWTRPQRLRRRRWPAPRKRRVRRPSGLAQTVAACALSRERSQRALACRLSV